MERSKTAQSVARDSYRAVLRGDVGEEQAAQAFAACRSAMERVHEEGVLFTASLYRYGRFLFLYAEGAGDAVSPDGFLAPLKLLLESWPAAMEEPDRDRRWVHMQPCFYHALPGSGEEWMRGRNPSLRRGRIALLAPGRWENYMRYHLELMREGLIEGDRYHLISIHENVLFSYFEEPKTVTNLCKKQNAQSTVLEEWMRTDPEGHFTRFAPGQGAGPDQNFVFLPCVAWV